MTEKESLMVSIVVVQVCIMYDLTVACILYLVYDCDFLLGANFFHPLSIYLLFYLMVVEDYKLKDINKIMKKQ